MISCPWEISRRAMTKRPKNQKHEIPRLTEPEMIKFIDDFLNDLIFTSAHLPRDDEMSMNMVFMPFATLTNDSLVTKDLGIIWEYLSKAGPCAINGYPMFLSARFMHKDDWTHARKFIIDYEEKRKQTLKTYVAEMYRNK